MTFLLTQWKLVLAGVLAVLLGLSCIENARLRTRHAEYVAKAEKAAHEAAEAARFKERQWSDKVTEIATNAEAEKNALAVDLAASRDAADRLRTAATGAVSRACPRPSASGSGKGEPGTDPLGVLVDVLGRLEERGRAVSEYADRLAIAGKACERAYDAVSK